MTELDVRILCGYFFHIVFKPEACCKDNVASFFYEFSKSCITFCIFRHIIFVDDLVIAQSQFFLHFLCSQIMIVCISHIARIGNMYKSYLDFIFRNSFRRLFFGVSSFVFACVCRRSSAPCNESDCHSCTQECAEHFLLHCFSSFYSVLFKRTMLVKKATHFSEIRSSNG